MAAGKPRSSTFGCCCCWGLRQQQAANFSASSSFFCPRKLIAFGGGQRQRQNFDRSRMDGEKRETIKRCSFRQLLNCHISEEEHLNDLKKDGWTGEFEDFLEWIFKRNYVPFDKFYFYRQIVGSDCWLLASSDDTILRKTGILNGLDLGALEFREENYTSSV
jgi:hypothetical protein